MFGFKGWVDFGRGPVTVLDCRFSVVLLLPVAGQASCKIMKTLVLGASEKEDRYANKAVRLLREYDHEVVAVGRSAGRIGDVVIQTGQPKVEGVDTVTLYLGPHFQAGIVDYVIGLKPRRVIFNPGTENPYFQQTLEAAGIAPMEACTLVLLRTDQF